MSSAVCARLSVASRLPSPHALHTHRSRAAARAPPPVAGPSRSLGRSAAAASNTLRSFGCASTWPGRCARAEGGGGVRPGVGGAHVQKGA
eukprot:7385568-Prymnesium_polylepis.1